MCAEAIESANQHPFGSCKEQTSGNVYSKALAEQGFVVIPYGASFQGASGGEPRWIEDPTQRVGPASCMAQPFI